MRILGLQQLTQYDTGRYIEVDCDCNEVDMSIVGMTETVTVYPVYQIARIPENLLKHSGKLSVYCIRSDGENRKTISSEKFFIKARARIR